MDGIIILEVPVSFHHPRAWYDWSWEEAAGRVNDEIIKRQENDQP